MRLISPITGLIVLVLFPWLPVAAEPLTLAEAEERAIARDAARDEMRARAIAEGERALSAAALPDPQISLGLQNVPVGSLAFDRDPMTQVMLGIEQRIPPGSLRDSQRERGRMLAESAAILADDRERLVRYALREAWFAAQTAQRLEHLAERVGAETDGLLNAAEGRYATGGGRQSDFLAARLKLDRLTDRLLRAREQQSLAQASLRRWLGEVPRELAPATLPEPVHGDDDGDELFKRLEAHPQVVAAEARIAAGQAGEAAANAGYRPSWRIGASYGYRRDMEGMGGEPVDDLASVTVGISLPLFNRNRQDRELSAARSETRAARFNREDLLRELSGRLDAAWRRHHEAVEQLSLYEDQLLPVAQQAVTATEQAYADNAASFNELAEAYIDRFEIEARRLELIERVQRARAEILYLSGEPQ